jgi:hypothetical protein
LIRINDQNGLLVVGVVMATKSPNGAAPGWCVVGNAR